MARRDGTGIVRRAALSPQGVVMALFFLQSMSFGGWYARVGDVQLDAGLNSTELGIALMGSLVGAVLTYPLGPPAVERFGTRLLVLVAIPVTALGCALGPLAPNAAMLFVFLVLNGLGHGFSTIAINVEADRVEGMTGRRIMNTCHGTWSLGFVLSTLIGTAARVYDISPLVHLGAMVPVAALGTLLVAGPMREASPRLHIGMTRRRVFAMPTPPILLLIAFVLTSNFIEGSAFVWIVIYFRDMFAAPVWIQSAILPVFLATTALGRLLSDRWVERWGPQRVAAALSGVAFVGLLPVAWAGSLELALVGFAVIGFGCSVIFPLSVSAAARIGDRPASENVASFSVIQRTQSLLVPLLVGLIAGQWNIAMAFAAMLPLPLLSIWLARHLEPGARPGEAPTA